MRNRLLALAATFGLATLSNAQATVTFSPNPAPIGASINIEIQDTSGQGFTLGSPCGWVTIRQGSQTGPIVGPNLFCIQILISVAADGSFSLTWDQLDSFGAQVPAGRYWADINFFDSSFNSVQRWFCFDIVNPNDPIMTEGSPGLQVGQTTPFNVSAPTLPNATYVVLFGFDAQTPISLPGFVDLCLSPPLFDLHIDILDGAGQSSSFQFAIPNDPSLAYEAGMFQTLIIDPATSALIDTNALSLFIAP